MIGTGANDPQKMDPKASRETLDHSIMYIFAVALEDGHLAPRRQLRPQARRRARRPWRCGTRSRPARTPEWTRRYRATDPAELAFGARVEITLKDGRVITDEMAVANAHPLGAKPFGREDYIRQVPRLMTDGIVTTKEAARFLEAVQDLAALPAGELHRLNVALPAGGSAGEQARNLLRQDRPRKSGR